MQLELVSESHNTSIGQCNIYRTIGQSQEVQMKIEAESDNTASRAGPHPTVSEQCEEGRAGDSSQVQPRARMTNKFIAVRREDNLKVTFGIRSGEGNWDQIQPSDDPTSPHNETDLRSSWEGQGHNQQGLWMDISMVVTELVSEL